MTAWQRIYGRRITPRSPLMHKFASKDITKSPQGHQR
jgi:hypothetical protein